MREQAVAGTLAGLLPVLDAIGQARDHGELSGGFKSVADSLQAVVGKLGLVSYGQRGDPFDPKIHEALTHTYSPDVDRGHLRGDLPARLQGRASGSCGRPGWRSRNPATGPDGSGNKADWPSDQDDNN